VLFFSALGYDAQSDIRAILEGSPAFDKIESIKKGWRAILVFRQKSHLQHRAIRSAHPEKPIHSPGVRRVFWLVWMLEG
jgi:hypothetical protein